MNNLKKYAMIGTLALAALAGCKDVGPRMALEKRMPEAKGYDVRVLYGLGKYNHLKILVGKFGECQPDNNDGVAAEVYYRYGVSEMTLANVRKGSKLEELASAQKIQEIYDAFRKKHPECYDGFPKEKN